MEPMTFINDRQIEAFLAIVFEKVWQHSLRTEDDLTVSAAAEFLPVSNPRLIYYMLGYEPRSFRDRSVDLTA